jgi:hypothetical protein
LTAAEIACIFGVSSQAIRKKLRAVCSTGKKSVSGNLAGTWNWSALPDALRSRLVREAHKRGFETVGAWHRNGLSVWTPPVPLSEIADECLTDAARLRRALLPSLRNHFAVTQSDFEREGLDDFEKVFCRRISGHRFRELIRRTVERDGGAENWERLELYLSKKPARKPKAAEPKQDLSFLIEAINAIGPMETITENKVVPLKKNDLILEKVFVTFADMVKAGIPRKRAARQMRAFVCEHVPGLAPNHGARSKMFDRRLQRWESGESFDKRKGNGYSTEDGSPFNQSELTKQIKALPWFIPAVKFFYLLTNRTENTGSMPEAVMCTVSLPNLPTGWPEGITKQLLKKLGMAELPTCPADLRKTILARRKDYQALIPKEFAAQIRPNKSIVKMFRSPKAWALDNLCAPGSQRRFFNRATNQQREIMQPGDWFGGDDATPGIAVCVPCSEVITPCSQKFGMLLGRFQWLAYLDGRTDKILAFDYVIRPRGSYRAEDILNGMGAVLRTQGVPRQGWQFEGGIWNSKIVREAIRQLDCEHWLTYSPHQKPIESVFNKVWTRLALQFPHADMGRFRNENERNCRLYEACKRGHKDPRRYFPPVDLVVKVFVELIAEHNSKPIDSRQYGRWVPDDFFHGYVAKNKLRDFNPEMDWILSPYAVERKVRGCLVKCRVPLFENFSVPFEFNAPWMPLHSGKLVRIHFNPREPRCVAKVVLLENSGERKPGDILGDAQLISETAAHIRFILSWGNDNQQAGFIAKQQTADFMRRETRGVGAGGRIEYSQSEQRDGTGQIGIIERVGAALEKPADDKKTFSRKRLERHMGTESPALESSTRPPATMQGRAESDAVIAELERRSKVIFE